MHQAEEHTPHSENPPTNPLEEVVVTDEKPLKKIIAVLKRLHNSPLGLLFHLCLMGGLGIGLVWVFIDIYLPHVTLHNQTITVPDLRGLTLQEATQKLTDMGLRVEVYDSSSNNYDKNKKPLEILQHDPYPDERVKPNRIIYLTINPTTPPMVRIPESILANSVKNAQVRFRALGLNMKIKYIDGDFPNTVEKIFYEKKEIKRDALAKGFYVPRGSEILLWVSNGITSDNHYVDVPDLYGVQLDEAVWILTGVGLVIGKITATDSEHPLGTVIEQKPEREEPEKNGKQRIGSVIDVVISNGRKPIVDSMK